MRSSAAVGVLACAGALAWVGALASCRSFGSDASDPDAGAADDAGPGPDADATGDATGDAGPGPDRKPEKIAQAMPVLRGLALTATYAYFTTDADNSVLRVPLDGTVPAPETVAPLPLESVPSTITTSGTTIFVGYSGNSNEIGRFTEDDVPSTFTSMPIVTHASALAVVNDQLWWSGGNQNVYAMDPNGSVKTTFSLDGGGGNPLGLAYDGTTVWIAMSSAASIVAVTPSGPAPTAPPFSSESDARDIVAAAGRVFWTRASDGLVRAASPTGTVSTIATGAGDVRSIAADATSVYWMNEEGVYRARHDGSQRERLGDASWDATRSGFVVRAIAVTPKYVLWIDSGRGDVWRLAK